MTWIGLTWERWSWPIRSGLACGIASTLFLAELDKTGVGAVFTAKMLAPVAGSICLQDAPGTTYKTSATVWLGAVSGAAIGSLALFLSPLLHHWIVLALGSLIILYPPLNALFVKIAWGFFALSVILYDDSRDQLVPFKMVASLSVGVATCLVVATLPWPGRSATKAATGHLARAETLLAKAITSFARSYGAPTDEKARPTRPLARRQRSRVHSPLPLSPRPTPRHTPLIPRRRQAVFAAHGSALLTAANKVLPSPSPPAPHSLGHPDGASEPGALRSGAASRGGRGVGPTQPGRSRRAHRAPRRAPRARRGRRAPHRPGATPRPCPAPPREQWRRPSPRPRPRAPVHGCRPHPCRPRRPRRPPTRAGRGARQVRALELAAKGLCFGLQASQREADARPSGIVDPESAPALALRAIALAPAAGAA